jgi:hypothetical protein
VNFKRRGGKRSWSEYKVLSQQLPGETEENRRNLSQDSRSSGPFLNPGRLEYKAGVRTTHRGEDTDHGPLLCEAVRLIEGL